MTRSRTRRSQARLSARSLVATLDLLAASSGSAAAAATAHWGWEPAPAVAHVDTAYTSAGVRVAVERFAPADGRCAPRAAAVSGHRCAVVLHPSSGLWSPGGATVRRWADALARGPHRIRRSLFRSHGGPRDQRRARRRSLPLSTAALEDAVTAIRRDPAVDPARVGAFGYSLGGYMALVLGAADRVVPVAAAERADRVLATLGVPHQFTVYPGQSHEIPPDVVPNAIARAAAFLDAADGDPVGAAEP